MDAAENARSVLFADVSGRARLHEKLGNPETRRAVGRCLKRVQRAVAAYGGRTIKSGGDQLIAVFTLADDAFHAALDMQQRVADLPPVSGVKLAIGVSFAHGALSEAESGVAGETVTVAAALARLAKPGQVLTSCATQATLSPPLQAATRDLAPSAKAPAMRIFEIVPAASPAAEPAPLAEPAGARLRLHYAGAALVLDAEQPAIYLGRGAENTLVIKDRRASRNHARIERREGQIVVIDTSTNGTFVTLSGQPEFVVHRNECVIHGSGLIYFAASANGSGADCAVFEAF